MTSVPLTGSDAFLRALELMMSRHGQGRHVGLTVLSLGAGFDADRFRSAVRRFAEASPIAAAELRQTPFTPPRWIWNGATQACFPIDEHGAGTDFHALCERRLNEAGAEAVGFDLVPEPDGSTQLVMRWKHLLLDGKGAELLLGELARLAVDPAAAARPDSWGLVRERRLRWREFLGEAERFKDQFYGNARHSIESLGGAASKPGRACFSIERFDREESARIAQKAEAVTRGMFSLAWFLAVSMRVHRAVFAKRGAEPESYQASCAVQERRKGARHPIWQNHVSQLFFCIPRTVLNDTTQAAALLQEQFATLSRARMDLAFATMARALRRLPASWYLKFLRRHSGGHLTSFFYSHTGGFLSDCASLAGAPIVNGWHVPSVSTPPGTGLFFSEHAGRIMATLSWREGALSEDEVNLMRTALREELLGR